MSYDNFLRDAYTSSVFGVQVSLKSPPKYITKGVSKDLLHRAFEGDTRCPHVIAEDEGLWAITEAKELSECLLPILGKVDFSNEKQEGKFIGMALKATRNRVSFDTLAYLFHFHSGLQHKEDLING